VSNKILEKDLNLGTCDSYYCVYTRHIALDEVVVVRVLAFFLLLTR
jgi:hypothetical protein